MTRSTDLHTQINTNTNTNTNSGPSHGSAARAPRWRHSAIALACCAVWAWATPGASAAATAWSGQVVVHEQVGEGCEPGTEGRAWPVQAVLEDGVGGGTGGITGLVWGEMLPAVLSGSALSQLAVDWLAPFTPAPARTGHSAGLQREGRHIRGSWQETQPAVGSGDSCFWTHASVSLELRPDAEQAAALAAGQRQRVYWEAAGRVAGTPSTAALAALAAAAEPLLQTGEADVLTAGAWHKAANQLLMAGRRAEAVEMTQRLPAWLALAARSDVLAAAGLALESGASARMLRQWPLADALYAQALADLLAQGHDTSVVRAALLSARGSLMLRARRVPEAQALFETALEVERRLTPGPSDGVLIATNNLARAWDAAGEPARAIVLLRSTLAELQPGGIGSNSSADPKLATLLRETLQDIETRRPAAAA